MADKMPKSWETRMNIFQAALSLLNTQEQELENITIRGIAKEAGVSIGTFYYYYETKYDVFLDSHKFLDDFFETEVRGNLDGKNAWEQLNYFFEQYHYYNVRKTPYKLYVALTTALSNSRHSAMYEYGLQHVLTSIVNAALQRGEIISDESAEEIVFFMLTCVRGFYRQWVVTDRGFDIDKTMPGFVRKVLNVYIQPPAQD